MSGWQKCGEGFLGVDKFKRVIADARDRASINNEVNKEEGTIDIDKTPDGKNRDVIRKKQDSLTTWKQGHFVEEFIIQHTASPKSDEISWSSSSDESTPLECHSNNRQGASEASNFRKRKLYSSKRCNLWLQSKPLSNRPQVLQTSDGIRCNSEKKTDSEANQKYDKNPHCLRSDHKVADHFSENILHTSPKNISERVNSHCLRNDHKVADNLSENLLCASKNISETVFHVQSDVLQNLQKKQNISSWTNSSFDIDPQATITAGHFPETKSYKSQRHCMGEKKQRGKFTKNRAARRLYSRANQESVENISDVESESEFNDSDVSQEFISCSKGNIYSCHKDIKTSQGSINNIEEDDLSSLGGTCQDKTIAHQLHLDVAKNTCLQEEEYKKNSQVSISCDSSLSCSSDQSEKIRASDWVKVFQKQKTPVKSEQLINFQEDSAKKKTKFARGSLAGRLSILIQREKASARFWNHSIGACSSEEKKNKSLMIKLLSLEKQFSVFYSRCLVMKEDEEEGHRLVVCRAVFPIEAVEKLLLKPGVTAQVFAPWHQLEESSGMKTIFCSHFVKILDSTSLELNELQEAEDSKEKCRITKAASWKCPCSSNSRLPARSCPATYNPVIPSFLSQALSCTGFHAVPSVTLHTITASPHPRNVPPSSRRTLLESLENKRGDNSHLPPFSALVLRIFTQRAMGTVKQWLQLLVEDSAGTLAIIKVPNELTDSQRRICQAGGKTCIFSGLHISSRTNRDKEPGLFQIIDQVWTKKFLDSATQESGGDASQIQLQTATPSFAYVLHSVSGVSFSFTVEEDGPQELSLGLVTLQQAIQSEPGTRVSFLARALLPTRSSWVSESMDVFVYDSSMTLENNITTVHKMEVLSDCLMEEADPSVYLFMDVLVQTGHFQCHKYTLALDMSVWTLWDINNRIDTSFVASLMSCALNLPPLSLLSEPGSIVSYEGSISGIDESSAYSWEECDRCGSDRLAIVEESENVYCTGCNRQVTSPAVRTRMEVLVTSKNYPTDYITRIDLTEKSIESLLPSEANDEGYDTEQVIGMFIKCAACLVLDRTSNQLDVAQKTPKIDFKLAELRC